MTPINIKETEPHIRQRYHFALSAFSRMYGVNSVNLDMQRFCYDWAKGKEEAPLEGLQEVDRYFKELWAKV